MIRFLLLLVVATVAVGVYLLVRLVQRRGAPHPTKQPSYRHVVAPDDDPDFLRSLNRKRKREQ